MGHPLLDTRGKDPRALHGEAFGVGTRVQVLNGDWGADNLGIVVAVAPKADEKGRWFVGVRMDGFRGHVGRPECAMLKPWADYVPGQPPLPHFEAGLLKVVEA